MRYTIRPIAEALEQYYEQQLIRLHEEVRRQAVFEKSSPNLTANTKNRRFNGSFTARPKISRRKRGVALLSPRWLTADGNADRTRLCMAFKNGYKSFNFGVAAIKTSLI